MKLFVFVPVMALAVATVQGQNPATGNLVKNPSFEEPGETPEIPRFWFQSSPYLPGIRTSERASDGRFSLVFVGNGKDKLALCQGLADTTPQCEKLQNAKLRIRCDVYVEAFNQGVIQPIHFIVCAKGKPSAFPHKAFFKGQIKTGEWVKIDFALDLSRYPELESICFYVMGWNAGERPFEGKFFVDNVVIESEALKDGK
jgi:hypothetical protein